jgi:uncharacterized protein Yka (UPF0111/DUF47 family)
MEYNQFQYIERISNTLDRMEKILKTMELNMNLPLSVVPKDYESTEHLVDRLNKDI